jgi:hypothetical protein
LVPCRSLAHLSTLRLERIIICLPDLEAIAPNLVHLSLQNSVLDAGHVEWEACDTFAKGIWGDLQTLNLSDACISAPLREVALPSLLDLRMDSFWQLGAGHVQAQGLGQGCPGCTSLCFHLRGMAVEAAEADQADEICRCSDFAALRSVSMVCGPDDPRPQRIWPVIPPALGLPLSVTRLEALGESSSHAPYNTLSLWTALALAGHAIQSRQVPLKELVCTGLSSQLIATEDCVYFADDPEGQLGFECGPNARMAEPTHADLLLYYARVLSLLNGLTSMSLTDSPACSNAMIDVVLAIAPDLRKLDCVIKDSMSAYDEERGLRHSIDCAKLSELQITYVLEDRQQTQATAKVGIFLQDSQCMQRFTLRVAERPTVNDVIVMCLRAQCEEGAELVSSFSKYNEAAACAELRLQRSGSTTGDDEHGIVLTGVVWDLAGVDGEGSVEVEAQKVNLMLTSHMLHHTPVVITHTVLWPCCMPAMMHASRSILL